MSMPRHIREHALTAAERIRRFNQESLFCDEDDQSSTYDPGETSSNRARRPQQEAQQPRPSKRLRTSTTTMSTPRTLAMLSPPYPQSERAVKVKSEEQIQAFATLQLQPTEERVQVFVGKESEIFEVGVQNLGKSPVLQSLVNKVSAEQPYIMHPELTKIDPDHFQSVCQFLLADEYVPAIIDNRNGPDVLPKRLDGCVTAEDYRNEALRAGHLYVIAKRLGMERLEELIRRKITQAQFQPYGVKCLLELAKIVFSRPEESELAARKGKFIRAATMGQEDALENWLVTHLKEKLQKVLINHARLFFEIAQHGACEKRGFATRIFRSKVEEWEALGTQTVAIEDDD